MLCQAARMRTARERGLPIVEGGGARVRVWPLGLGKGERQPAFRLSRLLAAERGGHRPPWRVGQSGEPPCALA